MKRLMLLMGMLIGGCVAGPNPGTDRPRPNYCDPDGADWGQAACTIVTEPGTYGETQRYVCPEPDGTEWELRVYANQNGTHGQVYQRYLPYTGSHIIQTIVCDEGDVLKVKG